MYEARYQAAHATYELAPARGLHISCDTSTAREYEYLATKVGTLHQVLSELLLKVIEVDHGSNDSI